MLRNILISILFLSTIWLLNGCDEIDGPYGNQIEIDDPTELTRKAVIFEFTGIHCTNCPQGHEAIEQIDSVYHGHVIPISVHAGYFATPFTGEPDFRTPFGNKLYDDLGQPPTPAVVIGSVASSNVIGGGPSTWQGEVGNVIPSYTKIIVEPELTFDGNEINVTFHLQQRQQTENSLLFYALILEDNIIGPQLGTDISPYTHRHVLRKSMGSISGTNITFTDGVSEVSYSSTIETVWNIQNISVVGIIVDAVTKEIYTGEVVKSIVE